MSETNHRQLGFYVVSVVLNVDTGTNSAPSFVTHSEPYQINLSRSPLHLIPLATCFTPLPPVRDLWLECLASETHPMMLCSLLGLIWMIRDVWRPVVDSTSYEQQRMCKAEQWNVKVVAGLEDGWTDWCMNGWMDRWMDGWMDGLMDGQTDEWAFCNIFIVSHKKANISFGALIHVPLYS